MAAAPRAAAVRFGAICSQLHAHHVCSQPLQQLQRPTQLAPPAPPQTPLPPLSSPPPTSQPAQIIQPFTVLLLQRRCPAFYRRHRELLVFTTHLMLTHIRAAVVNSMQAETVVGWKGGGSVGADEPAWNLFWRCGESVLEVWGLSGPPAVAATYAVETSCGMVAAACGGRPATGERAAPRPSCARVAAAAFGSSLALLLLRSHLQNGHSFGDLVQSI
jgi:hypothetical protein